MAETPLPSEQEFNAFMAKLNQFRDTLPESEQKILHAIVGAALGHEDADDVQAYWVATGPGGTVAVGKPGYGAVVVSPYATTYRVYYP